MHKTEVAARRAEVLLSCGQLDELGRACGLERRARAFHALEVAYSRQLAGVIFRIEGRGMLVYLARELEPYKSVVEVQRDYVACRIHLDGDGLSEIARPVPRRRGFLGIGVDDRYARHAALSEQYALVFAARGRVAYRVEIAERRRYLIKLAAARIVYRAVAEVAYNAHVLFGLVVALERALGACPRADDEPTVFCVLRRIYGV